MATMNPARRLSQGIDHVNTPHQGRWWKGRIQMRTSPPIILIPFLMVTACSVAVAQASPAWAGLEAAPASTAHYHVLPAHHGRLAPFSSVRIFVESAGDRAGEPHQSYLLEVRRKDTNDQETVALQLRLVADASAASSQGQDGLVDWLRYQLWIPGTGEVYDYRNVHTDRALLPPWRDFQSQFLPQPAPGARSQQGYPETLLMLGHILSLRRVENQTASPQLSEPNILRLDPELLIGTGRTFRDHEGQRRPQENGPNEYEYTPWVRADYEAMIEAGFNTFALVPGVESWLRSQPVFYRRGLKGDTPLDWPVDFFRSNYRGAHMYADEPACVMLRDKDISDRMLHFTDAAEVIQSRAGHEYQHLAAQLGLELERSGVSLGRLQLWQEDLAVWETRYETVFYQLAAGFQGFVHEGRYHLTNFYESPHTFDEYVLASTGLARKHTAEEMLKIHYAMMRGAARRFGRDWGTSLYGQADPALGSLALRLAYQMGARYLWYWTSGHAHHVPWHEQLAWTQEIREYARAHPRPSLRSSRPVVDRLILIPYGYFLVLESPMKRRHHWDLWWLRDLDSAGQNKASRQYRQLMRNVFEQLYQALDQGESFDIAVDDGHTPVGYRRIVRVGLE